MSTVIGGLAKKKVAKTYDAKELENAIKKAIKELENELETANSRIKQLENELETANSTSTTNENENGEKAPILK